MPPHRPLSNDFTCTPYDDGCLPVAVGAGRFVAVNETRLRFAMQCRLANRPMHIIPRLPPTLTACFPHGVECHAFCHFARRKMATTSLGEGCCSCHTLDSRVRADGTAHPLCTRTCPHSALAVPVVIGSPPASGMVRRQPAGGAVLLVGAFIGVLTSKIVCSSHAQPQNTCQQCAPDMQKPCRSLEASRLIRGPIDISHEAPTTVIGSRLASGKMRGELAGGASSMIGAGYA